MVKVICDRCGYESGYKPMRPLYYVDIQSTNVQSKNNNYIFVDDVPLERTDYCICGKCLTKFNAHVAAFFESNMEDMQ